MVSGVKKLNQGYKPPAKFTSALPISTSKLYFLTMAHNPNTLTPQTSIPIHSQALKIVQTLQARGFKAYLVGGCVRDALLNLNPKDFDIATNASPNQVKRNIPNSFIIGRRFRIVLVKRGDHEFEVTTFRRNPTPEEEKTIGDNFFGKPEEDALRRDFTVNALFYNPTKNLILDWTEGLHDLRAGIVRSIGPADRRFTEDPIRILRAIRLTNRISFALDYDIKKAAKNKAHLLTTTAIPRRREEFLKLLRLKDPSLAFLQCFDFSVFKHILPSLHHFLALEPEEFYQLLRLTGPYHKGVPPEELFAQFVFCWIRGTQSLKNLSLQGETLTELLKSELGLFNHEKSYVLKLLHIIDIIKQKNLLKKWTPTRLTALASHRAFPQALILSRLNCEISTEQMAFWMDFYEKLPSDIRQIS